MSNLRHTPVGATVTVRKIEGEGATRRRIMDMGITRGAEIYVRKGSAAGRSGRDHRARLRAVASQGRR